MSKLREVEQPATIVVHLRLDSLPITARISPQPSGQNLVLIGPPSELLNLAETIRLLAGP